jgi:hypothetical protein
MKKLLNKLKQSFMDIFLDKKRYSEGVYEKKVVYIATMNDTYALVSYTKGEVKLFKVDIKDLTELK